MLFSALVFSKISIDIGSAREVFALRGLVATFMVYLVADALWALAHYGVIGLSSTYVDMVGNFTAMFIGVCSWYWFIYGEYKLGASYANKRWFIPVSLIPIFVMALIFLLSWVAMDFAPGFELSAQVIGQFSIIPVALTFIFLFWISIQAMRSGLREHSTVKRHEYFTLVLFIVFPVAMGIFDLFIPGLPVIALSVFSSVLLVFLNQQESRIYTDALTNLNNRRRVVEYAEEQLAEISDQDPLLFFLIDIDLFKRINDSFGHAEGDQALCAVADGLRAAVASHSGLAGRWGGDEFVALFREDEVEQGSEFVVELREKIGKAAHERGISFPISVSVGCVRCTKSDLTMSALIANADELMYAEKDEHHKEIAGASA